MIEKYTLNSLTQDKVRVKKQLYTIINDVEYAIGVPWSRAYENKTSGRADVEAELPQAQQDAIFAIWGDTATVSDTVIE